MTTLGLEYLKHTEQQRSNLAKEKQAANELQETSRANRVGEEIKQRTLEETARHNLAQEKETFRSNLAKELETARSNVAREEQNAFINAQQVVHWSAQDTLQKQSLAETSRHNKVQEELKFAENVISGIETGSKVLERGFNAAKEILDLVPILGALK